MNTADVTEDEATAGESAPALSVSAQIPRIGDREKCPICGTQIDPEAYHCPSCHNYFCFHCRARLLKPDVQLQCVNQQCNYYGKLVCSLCDAVAEKEEPPSIFTETDDGFWPIWLVLTILAAILVGYYANFLIALGTAVVLFGGGGFALQKTGLNIFGRLRSVELTRKSSYYTCLGCQQPVRELEGS
jgi:hypothetical protein